MSPRALGWKRAFKYALKVLAFSAVWLVIGIALIFAGIALIPSALGGSPAVLLSGLILFGVGYAIIYVGFLAAIFRYLPEAIVEEMKQSG